MRSILLATAAASVLAFLPLLASAQNGVAPSTAPTTQTQMTPSAETPSTTPAPMASGATTAPSASGSTTTAAPAADASSTSTMSGEASTASAASAGDRNTAATGSLAPDGSLAQPSEPNMQAQAPDTNMQAQAPDADMDAAGQTGSYATQSAQAESPAAEAYQTAALTAEDELQLARDAGMSAVPVTAQQVCAQRTVTLSGHTGMTRAQKVENAVDRASACELQSLVINAPSGEASRLQRQIVQQGVSEEMITTQSASSSDASVQMTFAGLATSNEQYAALFNQQYAAADTSGYAQPMAPGAAPAPEARTTDMAPDMEMSPSTPDTSSGAATPPGEMTPMPESGETGMQ